MPGSSTVAGVNPLLPARTLSLLTAARGTECRAGCSVIHLTTCWPLLLLLAASSQPHHAYIVRSNSLIITAAAPLFRITALCGRFRAIVSLNHPIPAVQPNPRPPAVLQCRHHTQRPRHAHDDTTTAARRRHCALLLRTSGPAARAG